MRLQVLCARTCLLSLKAVCCKAFVERLLDCASLRCSDIECFRHRLSMAGASQFTLLFLERDLCCDHSSLYVGICKTSLEVGCRRLQYAHVVLPTTLIRRSFLAFTPQ